MIAKEVQQLAAFGGVFEPVQTWEVAFVGSV